MFAKTVRVLCIDADGHEAPCPVAWIDNFAMRNFTNDAVFDDTLPVGDGLLEVGNRVPVLKLEEAMLGWFRRKGYLKSWDRLSIVEAESAEARSRTEAGSSLRSE